MRKYILLSSLYSICFSALAQTAPPSLAQCYELARQHSPLTEQLSMIRETARNQTRLLRRSQMPQASVNGQATWQSEVTHISVPVPGIDIVPPPQDQYKATVDVTQSLWDGGVINKQKKLAIASQKTEEQKLSVDLYTTRELVNTLYFGALLADRQQTLTLSLQKELSLNLARIKASVANGVAIESNLLTIEARILETEQQLLLAQKNKQTALESLSLLCGVNFDPAASLPVPAATYSATEELLRPELSYLDAQKEMLIVNEQLIRAKNLPKLTAFATGGYGRPSLNFLSTTFNPYFIGGVQLKIPLAQFYTGSQAIELQQLRISKERIESQKKNFILNTRIKLTGQHREVQRLQSLLAADQELITIRTKIKQTSEAQLQNGVITATDYLTELNNEDIARQNEALHQIQLLQTLESIQLTTGN